MGRAKSEKEAYVVWLQLRTDSMSNRQTADYNEIFIEYWVFAPTTAKVKTSGRTHQAASGRGGVVVIPRTRTSLPTSELLLKQAAREAAERILAAMRDVVPGGRVPS